MANQFVIGHEHCGVCGGCLLFPAQLHRCPETVRPDILAVYLLDSQRVNVPNVSTRDVKSPHAEGEPNRLPSAKLPE